MPTGKIAPSIRAALVIEPNEPLENQDHDDDKTMIDEDLATQFVDDQPMDMVNHRGLKLDGAIGDFAEPL